MVLFDRPVKHPKKGEKGQKTKSPHAALDSTAALRTSRAWRKRSAIRHASLLGLLGLLGLLLRVAADSTAMLAVFGVSLVLAAAHAQGGTSSADRVTTGDERVPAHPLPGHNCSSSEGCVYVHYVCILHVVKGACITTPTCALLMSTPCPSPEGRVHYAHTADSAEHHSSTQTQPDAC